jgi:hypothetical protein
MRSPSIFFLVTMLVLSLRVSLADDATVKDEVGRFYGPFGLNSDGQAHFDALCHGFLTQVPTGDQADVLADMTNQALTASPKNYSVVVDVILFLQNLGKDIVWTQHLSDTMWSLGRSADLNIIRLDALRLLATRNDPTSRQIVVAALNDPDGGVRYLAVNLVNGWNDALPTFQKFVQDHQTDPAYAQSMEGVTYALHGLRHDRSVKDYVSHFYGIFNAPQGDVPDLFYPFGRDVPLPVQSEVLDQMLDRAISEKPNKDYVAIANVLDYRGALGPKIPSSDRFETDLKKLSLDSNPYAREAVILFMGTVKGEKYTSPIISALNDSNAEVRSRAITTIWQREDAKMVFNNYVLKHQGNPAYELSVENVKSALAAMNASGQNGK